MSMTSATSERSLGARGSEGGISGLLSALAPVTHALLRIGAGLLFMQHGGQKLFGWLDRKSVV